ncbi:MAG: hypothetical protein GC152_03140 [Alphaproteobacteria bacterium]|nr:hypothetical protein [Alphaproteobacteria bacterium]
MRMPIRFLAGLSSAMAAAAPASAGDGAWTGSRLLALVDGDMAATAYADGKLHPIGGAADTLYILDPEAGRIIAQVPVSNTVMGWPGSLATSADGRFAYVVTSRGGVARDLRDADDVFDAIPPARTITTINLEEGAVLSTLDACHMPKSVDIAPDDGWLLVACGTDKGEIAIVPLLDGLPQAPQSIDLTVPAFAARERDEGATFAAIRPDGAAGAVVLGNQAVAALSFKLGADGAPVAARAGPPLRVDRWLSVARWTNDGSALIVADVAWGPKSIDAALNGSGSLVAYAFAADGSAREASEAAVSKSPEAFGVSRDGRLAVAVNMERTYLPGGLTSILPGRNASSASLVSIENGTIRTLGERVAFRGVLPEDAVFDADGDTVAIAVYQDHGDPRSDGWIEFFRLVGEGDARRIEPADRRIRLPRGVHDLAAID